MSMTHSSYLLDGGTYRDRINGPVLDAERAADWKSATKAVQSLFNRNTVAKMPEWKQELISLHFDDLDELLKPHKETLEHIRDLHLLGILGCCIEQGEGYGKAWDLLKEGLRRKLGNEVGDELVLGSYWEGSAWGFVPDFFSYQFGFLENERLRECSAKAGGMTEELLISALQERSLKDNYPFFQDQLDPKEFPWVVDALRHLKHNLDRAAKGGFALFYTLD